MKMGVLGSGMVANGDYRVFIRASDADAKTQGTVILMTFQRRAGQKRICFYE